MSRFVDDNRSRVTGRDTVARFLRDKIRAGDNVTITVLNPGDDESLRISSGGPTLEDWVAVSATDTTPDYLGNKITADYGVELTVNNPGGNETLNIGGVATVTTGELHVYADGTSGSDANDGLTALTPKKTLGAVFDLVPDIVKHLVMIHLSGTFSEPGSTFIGFWTVRYAGKVVITGEYDTTVLDDNGGAHWTTTGSATTGVTVAAAGWTPDEWAGRWIKILDGAVAGQKLLVQGNTADTLTFCQNASASPGVGVTFDFVRPKTEIAASTSGTLYFFNSGYAIILQNIYFSGTKINVQLYGPGCMLQLSAVMSASTATLFINSNPGGTIVTSSTTTGATGSKDSTYRTGVSTISAGNGIFSARGSLAQLFSLVCTTGVQLTDCYITISSGCAFIGGSVFSRSGGYQQSGTKRALMIYNYGGYAGIRFGNPIGVGVLAYDSNLEIDTATCDISDCGSHGIEAVRSLVAFTVAVTGTGNAGVGVYAHSGSVVHIKDGSPPTLTGAVGDLAISNPAVQEETWANIDAGVKVSIAEEMTMAKEVS